MHRHELSAEQWGAIERLLPRKFGRPSKVGDRLFVNAVLWIAKTGTPWRDLHPRFGPWKTIYNRFRRWAVKGVWKKVFKELRVDVDPDGSIADATIVRSHQHAAGGKGGSTEMLLAGLAEVFPPRSTLSWTLSVNRSTSSSRRAKPTRPPLQKS
jgi:transposase